MRMLYAYTRTMRMHMHGMNGFCHAIAVSCPEWSNHKVSSGQSIGHGFDSALDGFAFTIIFLSFSGNLSAKVDAQIDFLMR